MRHTGGNVIWGDKYQKDIKSSKLTYREEILTAQRWGQFTALDIAFSSLGLYISGERNFKPYAVNAAASVSAGIVAWSIESLTLKAFPLSTGMAPAYISGFVISTGGLASWLATGGFILTKYIVMTTWKEYERQVALEIENNCRKAEAQSRYFYLKNSFNKNSQQLESLLGNYAKK